MDRDSSGTKSSYDVFEGIHKMLLLIRQVNESFSCFPFFSFPFLCYPLLQPVNPHDDIISNLLVYSPKQDPKSKS